MPGSIVREFVWSCLVSEREQKLGIQIEDNTTEGEQHLLAKALAETAAILNRSLDLDEVLV